MAANNCDDDESTGILYESLTYAEWPQEPEIFGLGCSSSDETRSKQGVPSSQGSWWQFFHSSCIPGDLSQLINGRFHWHFAVGGEGKVVAILQDQTLEIRSYKDDYSSIVGKSTLGKDPFPQWRKLSWSPDCSMLALSYSNGSVDFFDALGCKIFSIASELLAMTNDLVGSLAAVLWLDLRVTKTNWSYEVLFIDFKGNLRSFFVSPSDGYEASHNFSFTKPTAQNQCGYCGVTAAVYHSRLHLLICAGSVDSCSSCSSEQLSAGQCGITTWRLLSDAPHYRLCLSHENEKYRSKLNTTLFQSLPNMLYRRARRDVVFKLCVSPNGTFLAALHTSGTVSIWELPSLRLNKVHLLHGQPEFDVENPFFTDYTNTRKKYITSSDPLKSYLTDLDWWSNKALIVARCSGAVTVSSVRSFENLLGGSAEWFDGYPRVSAAYDRGFFVMECDRIVSLKRRCASPAAVADDENDDSDSSENDVDDPASEASLIRRISEMIKTVLYYVTDSEKFQPPRRIPKFLLRTYRLTCLKATTPESLFSRKLDNEEYGEALSLAQLYGLDCNLVYQHQWKNSAVSVASIQDYLSKVTTRSWVLHECVHRVPETLCATRALLEYGFQGTDLEALISIGQGTDEGRYIARDAQRVYMEDSLDLFSPDAHEAVEAQEREVRHSLLAQVDFSNLNLEQKQLCQTRQKLLQYLDRLNTYEVMLGGLVSAEHFDYKFFHRFRAQPAVETCVEFARLGNWQAVAVMFTYHGEETLPHQLAILSNFPETISPFEYRSLLPEAGYKPTDPAVYPWDQEVVTEKDWANEDHCRRGLGQLTPGASAEFLYEDNPELEWFCGLELTAEHLTRWYTFRAIDIERRSRLVDCALDLIRLGMERNVVGLTELHDDLVTLEVLVYECFVDDALKLEHLQSMSDIDKLRLLMSRSSEDQFIKNVRCRVLPFLARCDRRNPGSAQRLMREYLISMARHSLSRCAKIFDNSRVEQSDAIVGSVKELISLALDCIYSCDADDQLEYACSILECLPVRGYGSDTESLHDQLDVLERHLAAAEILQKHGVTKPIVHIRHCQGSVEEVRQLLTLLTRVASRKIPEVWETHWREILRDVLTLQQDAFQCIDRKTCLEIFVESMLCSGNIENILLAGELLEGSKKSHDGKGSGIFRGIVSPAYYVSVKKAVSLVIDASKEYFNSASDYNDPSMELARHCLSLIKEANENIQAEFDLIDTLPVLQEFGVVILPLHVRLCDDRLQLIKQAFATKPTAYQSSQKLMKLAHLMRVGQDVSLWEGEIQILVASAAIKAQDYSACYQACHYLGMKKYARGWKICLKLGNCDMFTDTGARQELLSFAAIHCTGEHLAEIVDNMRRLEMQNLHARLQNEFGLATNCLPQEKEETVESGASISRHPKTLARHLNQLTSETAKVLESVGNIGFWRKSTSWIPPTWKNKLFDTQYGEDVTNWDFQKISLPAFYASLVPGSIESLLSANYCSYAMPVNTNSNLLVGSILLRLAFLQNANGNAGTEATLPQVLRDVAAYLLPQDSLLALDHLLMLNDPAVIDECFEKVPNTSACLQLAILCFSLKIHQAADLTAADKLFGSDSSEIVKCAVRYAKTKKRMVEADENLSKFKKLLLDYDRKHSDLVQAKVLHDLRRGVDVIRFSQDDEYKRETVLGLVMSTDDKVYKTAISLAHRYQIALWDVYMAHLTYLFCEEDVATPTLEQRVASLDLLPVLLEKPTRFESGLKSNVYECISGTDHTRYLYYLNLLEKCSPKNKKLSSTTALLRKLHNIVPDVDFKRLCCDRYDLLKVLSPVTCGANIQAIIKTLPTISKVCQRSLEPSALYREWLTKVFFLGDDKQEKTPRSHQEWLARYASCKNHFLQLDVRDLMAFVDSSLFVERSLDDIPESTRRQLLNGTLSYAKQALEKCNQDDSQRQLWQEAVDYFDQGLQHLDRMRSELVEVMRGSGDAVIHSFLRKLEISRPDAAKSILIECAIGGHSVETLQQLVSICPMEVGLTPGDVILEAVSIVRDAFTQMDCAHSNLLTNRDPIVVLQGILDAVLNHTSQGGDLVEVVIIVDQLQPLCMETSIPVPIRLCLLQLLEKVCPSDFPEFKTISTCKSHVIISSSWPDLDVIDEELDCDAGRENLFRRALSNCETLAQIETLAHLVLGWPQLPSSTCRDFNENCWTKLMSAMLNVGDVAKAEAVINVFRQVRHARYCFEVECLQPIVERLSREADVFQRLKFALLTEDSTLHKAAIQDTIHLNQEDCTALDTEICSMIVSHGLVSQTVATPMYQPLMNYILTELTVDRVKSIAKDLKSAGYFPEAASLLVSSLGIPESLRNFSTAVGVLHRFLPD